MKDGSNPTLRQAPFASPQDRLLFLFVCLNSVYWCLTEVWLSDNSNGNSSFFSDFKLDAQLKRTKDNIRCS